MTRVAAIDCGTNSIRLLISDISPAGDAPSCGGTPIADQKTDLVRELRMVRLGQGVDQTGLLAPEAVQRTFAAAREYADLIADLGASRISFCATSAARDAENGAEFADGIERILGVRPQVISGEAEARLSFMGAARDLPPGPTLVVDIGGGSTELVVGRGDEILSGTSVDVGSVRLTERFLASDPPTAAEVGDCMEYLDQVLAPAVADLPEFRRVVGVAGTITTIAAHVLHLPEYDSAAVHRSRLPVSMVRACCSALVGMSVAERRALGFMHPGRADVIGGGALVLDSVLANVTESELVVSEHDILDGIAWDAAAR